jgi:hypothetical protein
VSSTGLSGLGFSSRVLGLYLISLWKVLPLISRTSGEISLRRAATRASGDKPLIAYGIDLSEVPEQELFDACTRCGAQRTDAPAWHRHAGVECH